MRDFEEVLRENAGSELVGSQFLLSVIGESDGQLELSVRAVGKTDNEVVDIAVSGPNVEILEGV